MTTEQETTTPRHLTLVHSREPQPEPVATPPSREQIIAAIAGNLVHSSIFGPLSDKAMRRVEKRITENRKFLMAEVKRYESRASGNVVPIRHNAERAARWHEANMTALHMLTLIMGDGR